MSFFKDFKEDFAQAMNELMPESNEMYDEDEEIEEAVSKESKRERSTDGRKSFATKEKRAKSETKIQDRTSARPKKFVSLKKKVTEEKNDIDDLDIAPEDLSDQIDVLLDSELYGDEEQVQMPVEDHAEVDMMDISQPNRVMAEKDMGLEALLDSIANKNHVNGQNQEVQSFNIVSEGNETISSLEDVETLETVADENEDVEFATETTEELETVVETEELETTVDVEEKTEVVNDIEKMEEQDAEEIGENVEPEKLENIDEPAKLAELVQVVAKEENAVSEDNTMSEEKDIISINSAKAESAEEEKDFNVDEADTETTYITKGTTIMGDLESDGSIDIIGIVEGGITCKGKVVVGGTVNGNISSGELYANNAKITGDVKSYGSVKVGVGSVIVGNIEGESAVIAGAINGDIDVQGPVIVDSTAVIMGNIKSRSVQINNGAVIEGFCSQSYSDIDVKSFFE